MPYVALGEEHARSSDEPFEELYREHAPTVYRYALGVLRNPADAEDIVQSTFTNAYRAMLGGERPEKAENWLIKIAHNECRQRFRRLGRRATEVPLDDELAEAATPEDQAETAGEIDGVLKALAELPFNQRTALVMREVAGRSASEIAHFLGTSPSSVDMLLFRARRTLRARSASVGVLALVPLPRSLLSLGGGSAAKTVAAVGGLGTMGKAAAVLVAGVVAAGVTSSGTKPRVDAEAPAPTERLLEIRKHGPGLARTRAVERSDAPQQAPATKTRSEPVAAPERPVLDRPAVQTPTAQVPSPQTPATQTPTSQAPTVDLPAVEEPAVTAPSLPPPPQLQAPELPPPPLPVPEPPKTIPEPPELPEPPPPPESPLP